MHLLRSVKIRHAIAFGIGAAIGVLYLMSAIAANAETLAGVSIAANGQTIVSGAKVTHVTEYEITAVSQWGAAKIQWKIIPTGSTRYSPARDGKAITEMIHVGESIGFSGSLDQKSATPLLVATMIRNETVIQRSAVLDGSVISVQKGGVLVATDTGTSTIRVGTGTIMTKDGNRASIADLIPGETVKAFGTFNARERVLDAARVVSASLPSIPNTGAREEVGIFSALIAWLRERGGSLSVR